MKGIVWLEWEIFLSIQSTSKHFTSLRNATLETFWIFFRNMIPFQGKIKHWKTHMFSAASNQKIHNKQIVCWRSKNLLKLVANSTSGLHIPGTAQEISFWVSGRKCYIDGVEQAQYIRRPQLAARGGASSWKLAAALGILLKRSFRPFTKRRSGAKPSVLPRRAITAWRRVRFFRAGGCSWHS